MELQQKGRISGGVTIPAYSDEDQAQQEQLAANVSARVAINASGHIQEVNKNFSLLSLCGIAITSGVQWIALGASIATSILDGGPPFVTYELLASSFFYWNVAASLAELASAVPSSAGVFQWASMTGGRCCGWFAGWFNFFAWLLGLISNSFEVALQVISIYALLHPGFVVKDWHVFVTSIIGFWSCCALVLFGHQVLPRVEQLGLFFTLAGVIVTIVVCAVMPEVDGSEYAPSSLVWSDWHNSTGWQSNGFVFCLGMLNGAFTVGDPDLITHMAEEMPDPSKNIPKAMFYQYFLGFFTGLPYLVAIFYGISDVQAVQDSRLLLPIAQLYQQASGSRAGAVGLLVVMLVPSVLSLIGLFLVASRVLWTLAREEATPFPRYISKIDPKRHIPFNAILACAGLGTAFSCIYIGSPIAFNAFVSSFVLLSTTSYTLAILPNLLSGRRAFRSGWFSMRGAVGFIINGIACSYMIVFFAVFCFPFAYPATTLTSNYAPAILLGCAIVIGGFWLLKKDGYVGPVKTMSPMSGVSGDM